MCALLAIAIVGYLHGWSMNQHLEGSDREILLSDVHRFGANQKMAMSMYLTARNHRTLMRGEVESWNNPDTAGWWEIDTSWRMRCWSKLDDSMRVGNNMYSYDLGPDGNYKVTVEFSRDVAYRLECLYDLRAMIGKEAFESGWMPDPLPQYRRLPWK